MLGRTEIDGAADVVEGSRRVGCNGFGSGEEEEVKMDMILMFGRL